jgi:FkbM family methyltransferase
MSSAAGTQTVRPPAASISSPAMPSQASIRNSLHRANKLRRVLQEPSYRQALRQGVAATTEHEDVVFPREYGTVIDVGANRGQFALFALHRFPTAQLLCFEPLSEAHRKLTEVVGDNPRVRVERCAIGATEGNLNLNITRSDDSSSLLQPTALQLQTFPNTDAVSSSEVRVKTLDDVIEPGQLTPPFLLKIDVQGFELEVIKGAQRLLGENGDLLVESSFAELYADQALADEVVAALLSQGYRLRGIFSVTRGLDGAPLQGDFLFSRQPLGQ